MSQRKYKILVIGPGGRHIENFIERIRQDAQEIVLITDREFESNAVKEKHRVSFSLKRLMNHIQTPKKIAEIIMRTNPDIIHVHQLNSVAYYSVRANRKHKLPLVVTAWGSDVLINPEKSRILKSLVKYVLSRATAFTADAHFVGDKMQKLVPEKKLDVTICNFGVRETNLTIEKKQVVYSNRLHNKLYRIEEVLIAFSKFYRNNKDWKLIVAATGTETEMLQKKSIELGINEVVEFPGFVSAEENNKNYAKAKIYVSIPESDATAISLLEAMYYECIPVVSNLPANHEWVQDGVNGVIVEHIKDEFISKAVPLLDGDAGSKNRKIILEKSTENASRSIFVGLHERLISMK